MARAAERLTHFEGKGNAIMVDVGGKEETERTATAEGFIRVSRAVFQAIQGGSVEKGDVLNVARTAGIMAAKQTSALIPLCHPLIIHSCNVEFELMDGSDDERPAVRTVATVRTHGRTGAEMEALTAVSVALLTVYDMCKALDRAMEITDVRLLHKSGGARGEFTRAKGA